MRSNSRTARLQHITRRRTPFSIDYFFFFDDTEFMHPSVYPGMRKDSVSHSPTPSLMSRVAAMMLLNGWIVIIALKCFHNIWITRQDDIIADALCGLVVGKHKTTEVVSISMRSLKTRAKTNTLEIEYVCKCVIASERMQCNAMMLFQCYQLFMRMQVSIGFFEL